jgi:hypothetical protein
MADRSDGILTSPHWRVLTRWLMVGRWLMATVGRGPTILHA